MTASKDWKEVVPPGEDAAFEKIGAELAEMAGARDGGTAKHRALHPKGHLGARATLVVKGDLPEPARHGLFAKPGTYRAFVRFSNGAGRFQHDREPDLRGIAVKVLGVEGPKVLGDARTQDLLMIDVDKLAFRSVDEFVAVVRAGKNPKTLPQTLIRELGFFSAIGLVTRLVRMAKGKRGTLLDLTYNTCAPVAFGPYAARLSLTPTHAHDAGARAGADRDYLRADARTRHGKGELGFELRAQFFTSEEKTPIERSDVAWSAPWVTLGTLTLEPASADATRRDALDALVDRMSFDPWHALVEHRPLGAVMRARKAAYFASTQARKAAAEPDVGDWASVAS